MDNVQIRLKILESVLPQATRHGLTDPDQVVKTCKELEKYVLDSKNGEKSPDSPAKRPPGRPPKETTVNEMPSFLDPTHGG